MDEYVVWYSDLWGWDSSPGADTSDLLREIEVGTKAMSWERLENTSEWYWLAFVRENS